MMVPLKQRRNSGRDTRLDWRDPKMPCLRDYILIEIGIISERGVEEVAPDLIVEDANATLKDMSAYSYRNDLSYNWALKAKRAKALRLKNYGREISTRCDGEELGQEVVQGRRKPPA